MVSGILLAVVHADTAQLDQVTLLEPIDLDVIESEKHATAFPDSTRTFGNVLDAHMDKEDQLIKEPAKLPLHVPDQVNITVSGILPAAVHADTATKAQDGLSEPTDQDATDQE